MKELTLDYGKVPEIKVFDPDNHLGVAYKFFKGLNIDNKDTNLLDVGCGVGLLKSQVDNKWDGIDVVGKESKERKVCDIHELPYKDERFDIVFCCHVLEHVVSPSLVVKECMRVVKKEGSIIIAFPYWPYFTDLKCHVYLLTEGGWQHLFMALGCKVLKREMKNSCAMFHLKKGELCQ